MNIIEHTILHEYDDVTVSEFIRDTPKTLRLEDIIREYENKTLLDKISKFEDKINLDGDYE